MRSFTGPTDENHQIHAPSELDDHFSCQNCRTRMSTRGICGRCLDLPACYSCKRHLSKNCFDNLVNRLCQVTYSPYFFSPFCILTSFHITWSNLYINISISSGFVFQACSRKNERRSRLTRAVSNIVTEVDLSTSEADPTFDQFVRRNREHIRRTIDDHLQRYGCITKNHSLMSLLFPFTLLQSEQITNKQNNYSRSFCFCPL